MNELKKRLDAAYFWLEKVEVRGESVDSLAMARQELRAAFQLATAKSEEVEKNG